MKWSASIATGLALAGPAIAAPVAGGPGHSEPMTTAPAAYTDGESSLHNQCQAQLANQTRS